MTELFHATDVNGLLAKRANDMAKRANDMANCTNAMAQRAKTDGCALTC